MCSSPQNSKNIPQTLQKIQIFLLCFRALYCPGEGQRDFEIIKPLQNLYHHSPTSREGRSLICPMVLHHVCTLHPWCDEELRTLGSIPFTYSRIILGPLDRPDQPPRGIILFGTNFEVVSSFSFPFYIEVVCFLRVPINQLHLTLSALWPRLRAFKNEQPCNHTSHSSLFFVCRFTEGVFSSLLGLTAGSLTASLHLWKDERVGIFSFNSLFLPTIQPTFFLAYPHNLSSLGLISLKSNIFEDRSW